MQDMKGRYCVGCGGKRNKHTGDGCVTRYQECPRERGRESEGQAAREREGTRRVAAMAGTPQSPVDWGRVP